MATTALEPFLYDRERTNDQYMKGKKGRKKKEEKRVCDEKKGIM
jgi:hypothetical protein